MPKEKNTVLLVYIIRHDTRQAYREVSWYHTFTLTTRYRSLPTPVFGELVRMHNGF